MRKYALRMKHDAGTTTVVTTARNAAAAIDMILKAEGAPESAIQWISEQPTCDYCQRDATRRVRGSTDVVCQDCARSQTDGPVRDYVSSLSERQWPRWNWSGGQPSVPESRWTDRVDRGTPIVGLLLDGRPYAGLYGGEWELDDIGRVVQVNFADGPQGNVSGTFLRSDTVRLAS